MPIFFSAILFRHMQKRLLVLFWAGLATWACGSGTGPVAIATPTATATAKATATATDTPAATATATAAGAVVITIDGIAGGMSFSPALAEGTASQKVRWHNADSITHRVVDNGGAFDTGNIAPGTSSNDQTVAPGTHPYHCSIHPSMTGTLTVSN
jgi:plastocyanin